MKAANIPEFISCAKTYANRSEGILNAFKYKYTNGPTEGFNNIIKVLKRISLESVTSKDLRHVL
jgi:transposase